MLYLNTAHLEQIGRDWKKLIAIVRDSVAVMDEKDFAQPIKPYLRYGDPKNRIIAMPAYVGGATSMAGIKWIASFPDNIHTSRPRAHSVTILNEKDSGRPLCTINTNAVSAVRTAAVSGLLVEEYLRLRGNRRYAVGIIGFGPIGQMHLDMIGSLLGDHLDRVLLYDLKGIEEVEGPYADRTSVAASWEACYADADIFITCTVSDKPYVDSPPKKGSLQLNVSLRDYKPEMRSSMDFMVVDDWEEVCRQNTDIENMHRQSGLQKEDTVSIADVVCRGALQAAGPEDVIMFNPMGMAIFDIAIGSHYYRTALARNVGMAMPE